jgi:hypothetical protein
MGEIEPSSDDASLSTVLVYRADGFTHRPLERNQPTAGIKPALAGVLINQSKEPDAGPHVRFTLSKADWVKIGAVGRV